MASPKKNQFGHYGPEVDIIKVLEHEGVELKYKHHSRLMRAIGWLLGLFGVDFMGTFWTTISSKTIWVPDTVDLERDSLNHPIIHRIIRHELVHVDQARRLIIPGLWQLWFLLCLPAFLAYGRWWSEREAYMVNIMDYPPGVSRAEMIDYVVQSLWTNYGWTWPRSWMRKWLVKEAARRQAIIDAGGKAAGQ